MLMYFLVRIFCLGMFQAPVLGHALKGDTGRILIEQDEASMLNAVAESSRTVVSGRTYMAMAAVVKFRLGRQRAKLRPAELVVENFEVAVVRGDIDHPNVKWLRPEEKAQCFLVELIPKYKVGEEVRLDDPRKDIRRASYAVRMSDYAVIRSGW